ncbi:hypothetical protein HWV62_5875 [Athelia sp. TMB]|nr:hypothetical protein HWV62_5875 [Athelia sp. TMB]
MKQVLPLEPSYEGRVYPLKARTGPVKLRGGAQEGLGSLKSIWVDCIFSHGEISIYNADLGNRVVACDPIAADSAAAIPFIKRQLAICDADHGDHCSHGISKPPQGRVPPPRVYNIDEKYIQENDFPKDFQYIALSYIWGGEVPKPIQTVKENVDTRRQKGAFDLQNQRGVPVAYSSAVEVTRQLGLSHLWIDSICMIQDDDDDRERHFKRFEEGVGQIYQNARLTICSTGINAAFNLLARRTVADALEWVEIPLDGKQAVISSRVRHLFHHMAAGGDPRYAAGWDTRGWTFQEWLLSPRLAYFTDSQVFFECGDLYEERGDTSLSLDQNTRYRLRSDVDRDELVKLWNTIVTEYSKRGLGWWSDRLNAIRSVGMQLVMRIKQKTERDIQFHSGLLGERLHVGLLWQTILHKDSTPITQAEWRKGSEVVPPSWSWALWKGGIIWEWHLKDSSSGIEMSDIDKDTITLRNVELVAGRVGKSLALNEKTFSLQTYALEIGSKTCSQGYKMQHWPRMFALLHPDDDSIIGRASFDDAGRKVDSKETVECLLVSSSLMESNPHTFEETKSWNVLLVRKANFGYTRLGVGEIFKQTGDRVVTLPDRKGVANCVLV